MRCGGPPCAADCVGAVPIADTAAWRHRHRRNVWRPRRRVASWQCQCVGGRFVLIAGSALACPRLGVPCGRVRVIEWCHLARCYRPPAWGTSPVLRPSSPPPLPHHSRCFWSREVRPPMYIREKCSQNYLYHTYFLKMFMYFKKIFVTIKKLFTYFKNRCFMHVRTNVHIILKINVHGYQKKCSYMLKNIHVLTAK